MDSANSPRYFNWEKESCIHDVHVYVHMQVWTWINRCWLWFSQVRNGHNGSEAGREIISHFTLTTPGYRNLLKLGMFELFLCNKNRSATDVFGWSKVKCHAVALVWGPHGCPHPAGPPQCAIPHPALQSKIATLRHSTTRSNSPLACSQDTMSLKRLTPFPLMIRILELCNPLKHFPKSKREKEIVSKLFIKKIQVYK